MLPLIVIVGPTCTGKSQLAIQMAQKFNGEIINTDSVQIYQGVDIGTAKPSKFELEQALHHLYSFVPVGEGFTAGMYKDKARSLIEVIEHKGSKGPLILTGGSGFYIKALLEGMYDVGAVDVKTKALIGSWSQRGPEVLHKALKERDPDYAQKIPINDSYRVQRALELIISHNKTMTVIQNEFDKNSNQDRLKNPILKVGLNLEREELLPFVKTRCESMWDKGLLEETKNLIQQGYRDWKPLSSVGYKEACLALENKWQKEQFLDELTKNTLRLAKRQRTWFRGDQKVNWFHPIAEQKQNWSSTLEKVDHFLNSLKS